MKNIKILLVCLILTFSNQVSIAMTPEEELDQLLKEEAEELLQTRIEFIKCFTTNKLEPKISTFGCPKACHDAAFAFALIAGQDELDRVIKSIQ